MDQVKDKLSDLRLHLLDEGWVEGVYYSEFLELGEIPTDYENILENDIKIRTVFRNILSSVDAWLKATTKSNGDKSWSILSRQVPHRKLLALLGYYIHHGTKNVIREDDRTNALLASRVYFKLLSIPGYKAYNIYHSQLFAHSLACLGFPKLICDKYDEQKTKSRDESFDKEDRIANIHMLTEQVNSLIKQLGRFVTALRAIVVQLHLSPNDMNFEDILSNLVDVTGGAIVNRLNVDKIELGNISRVIYEVIDILICDLNDKPDATAIRLLFKCLLPKLIAACSDTKSANNLVRASYVTYSGLLLTKYGKAAINGYTLLLEHLCYNHDGLERAEARGARISMVAGLMSLLPSKSHRKTVNWLLQLSTTSKIIHRHFAIDLLEQMLNNDPELEKEKSTNEGKEVEHGPQEEETDGAKEKDVTSTDDSSQDSAEMIENPEHEITEEEIAGLLRQRSHTVPYAKILRAVYDRVHDASGTVRTRAIAILTKCLDNPRPPM